MSTIKEHNSGEIQSSPPTITGRVRTSRLSVWRNATDRLVARAISDDFDVEFYRSQLENPDSIVNPVVHYVRIGASEGLDPSPDFSTTFYRESNRDVLQKGVNPFWHFLKHGKAEGRKPLPSTSLAYPTLTESTPDDETALVRGHFDAEYYLAMHPDVSETESELLEHYMSVGWILGYDPCDWFSTRDYLKANPDVAQAKQNPFLHYILHGLDERRPLFKEDIQSTDHMAAIEATMTAIRAEFDEKYYLQTYRDVANVGVDPLFHYCAEGWREGRDPCNGFSSAYYLETNPDVVDAGMNPFQHYVVTGRSEGRFPQHPAGEGIGTLKRYAKLDDLVRDWTRQDQTPASLAADELYSLVSEEMGDGKLILSVSHDNYLLVAGGIQLCIQSEADQVRENGDSYLAIFPWQPLPRLATSDVGSEVLVALALNGENIGTVRMTDLIQVVGKLSGSGRRTVPVIHQLLGHSPEQVAEVVKATGQTDCIMWLHDFITLCSKFSLQRNDLSFCGAPSVSSNACSVCLYGEERVNHLRRLEELFDTLNIHVISPSISARAFWNARRSVKPASVIVQPHVKLSRRPRKTNGPIREESRAIRVAYLGAPMAHKGWNEFSRLSRELDQEEFEFFHLATEKTSLSTALFLPVHVKSGAENVMVRTLRENDIDLVLHWASWPETFSFTTFEAMEAGAFVLTNENSGNVAAAVRKHRRGRVLNDLDELTTFFSDRKTLQKIVHKRRETADQFEYDRSVSQMSLAQIKRLPQ